MKVLYSPDFKIHYDALPQSIQRQFQIVDGRIMSHGLGLDVKRMGWAHYVVINDHYCAVGSVPEAGVFYWVWIGTSDQRPVIL